MDKTWYGRIIYSGEGIEMEAEFKTKAESEAFVLGFDMAKEILVNGDEDALDDYFADSSDEEAVEE